MMLGDILAASRRSADGLERCLGGTDPRRAARLRAAAEAEGETPAGYLRVTVADFERLASAEDWATLTSRLRSSEEPGSAALAAMLDWRLAMAPRRRPDDAEGAFR